VCRVTNLSANSVDMIYFSKSFGYVTLSLNTNDEVKAFLRIQTLVSDNGQGTNVVYTGLKTSVFPPVAPKRQGIRCLMLYLVTLSGTTQPIREKAQIT
jgi:hypothetical protein